MTTDSIPVAMTWLLDSVGESGRTTIKSVFMIINRRANIKGTGFLLDTGFLVTNEHVVHGSKPGDLLIISSDGKPLVASELIIDAGRDLAVAKVSSPGGLRIRSIDPKVGVPVATWGYPLGYNGPAPLLAMGHLAGFEASTPPGAARKSVRRLVVNAAFNGGNSGGPLFVAGDDGVIGVVVSKHAPIPQFLSDAIAVLAANRSGIAFVAQDEAGNQHQLVESQIVAQVLEHFRNMTQVVIGEAVAAAELIEFLRENKVPFSIQKEGN